MVECRIYFRFTHRCKDKEDAGHHVRFRKVRTLRYQHETSNNYLTPISSHNMTIQFLFFGLITSTGTTFLQTFLSSSISHVFYNPMNLYVSSSRPLHHLGSILAWLSRYSKATVTAVFTCFPKLRKFANLKCS